MYKFYKSNFSSTLSLFARLIILEVFLKVLSHRHQQCHIMVALHNPEICFRRQGLHDILCYFKPRQIGLYNLLQLHPVLDCEPQPIVYVLRQNLLILFYACLKALQLFV